MTVENAPATAEELVGQWQVTIKGPAGPMTTTLDLRFEDGVLGGTQSGQGSVSDVEAVQYSDGKISWINHVTKPMKMKAEFDGEVAGETISGKVKAGFMGKFPFVATRLS